MCVSVWTAHSMQLYASLIRYEIFTNVAVIWGKSDVSQIGNSSQHFASSLKAIKTFFFKREKLNLDLENRKSRPTCGGNNKGLLNTHWPAVWTPVRAARPELWRPRGLRPLEARRRHGGWSHDAPLWSLDSSAAAGSQQPAGLHWTWSLWKCKWRRKCRKTFYQFTSTMQVVGQFDSNFLNCITMSGVRLEKYHQCDTGMKAINNIYSVKRCLAKMADMTHSSNFCLPESPNLQKIMNVLLYMTGRSIGLSRLRRWIGMIFNSSQTVYALAPWLFTPKTRNGH